MTITRLALVGSPNCGKTTLFNALTGLRQKIANYPGVTVEHVEGHVDLGNGAKVALIDLPGTYSLDPLSPDEQVTLDALRGHLDGIGTPDGVVIVADATTLRRSLPFVGEVLHQRLPSILVVTMIDELKARGGALKLDVLQAELGIPVVGVVGNRGIGLDDLKHELGQPGKWPAPPDHMPSEIVSRFIWADAILDKAVVPPREDRGWTDKLDKIVLHPILGLNLFALVMFLFFQIVFVVAAPLQDLMEAMVVGLGELLRTALPDGLIESLLIDGLFGGVGSVVVFVPQIALLLLMIAFLEGSGYMARAAFVIDRVMGWAGLEGRCFIALLSSYACAIPGIMATRAVPDPKSRLATIMVAPFMTCSARLPVYVLFISAFIPETRVGGVVNLQGLTMFGLYLLGSVSAMIAAVIFKRGVLRGQTYPFYMELPPYRMPTAKVVFNHVSRGVRAFLKKAGTIILVASIAIWALLHFPQVEPPAEIANDEAAVRAYQIEHSAAADIGRVLEPAIAPLGFDWKIGIGLIASLAAREVIVATLSQIHAYTGDEEDLDGLGERMRAAKRADGTPAYPLPTVLALLVFYVYALQCVSTLAVIRRETGTWRWAAIAFGYMFAVAYGGAFVTHEVASIWL